MWKEFLLVKGRKDDLAVLSVFLPPENNSFHPRALQEMLLLITVSNGNRNFRSKLPSLEVKKQVVDP